MAVINQPTLSGDTSLPSSQTELQALMKYDAGKHRYTVEDFFRKPEKSRYQLSPSGQFFSFLGPYKRRLNIFVQPVDGGPARRITTVDDRDIAWYFWKTDDRLVFAKDDGGDENFHLFAVDSDGNRLTELTPFEGVRIDLIDELQDHDDEIIVQMNKNNPQLFEPYRLNIITGVLQQLADNTDVMAPIDTWLTDHDGRIRVATMIQGGTNTSILYRKTEEAPFTEVLTTDFRENVSPLFFDFDNGDVVYASSNLGRDKSVIVRFDLSTGGEEPEVLFSHPDVDVAELDYSRRRKVLTAVTYLTDKRHLHFLDDETRYIYEHLEKQLGDYEIVITSA
ncbi:MAG: TolB family protein, partial [Saprospiraceae bacterium]